jgi:peptidoglycan/LPS O-acetylase OafA/YrhL
MKYIPSLDGLRAVAVMSVVIYHAHKSFCPGGWAGVDVFFVLSGFLISTILLRELAAFNIVDFKKFYMRRFLRLFPAFACLILVLLPISFASKHHRAEDLENIVMSATYLMNWNRAFGWIPGLGGSLAHTWSLSVEEQFYFIWPATVLLLARFKKFAPLVICFLATLVFAWRLHLVHSGANPERTYNGFDVHSDSLLIGCALAFFDIRPAVKILLKNLAMVPIALLLFIFAAFHFKSALTQGVGPTFSALCAAWIMTAAMEDGVLKRLLSFRPLVYTGRISYGWYLWHYPFLVVGGHIFPKSYEKPLLVAASYLTAMASYHFVEIPFLRLKHRFQLKASLQEPIAIEAAVSAVAS